MKRRFYTYIYVVILLSLSIINVHAQINPGELHKAHAHLEGVSNCTQCHSVGNKVTREKCLACHTEIANNIKAKKGYHASSEVNGKNCAECHSDHHGRNFQMVKFDKKTFDHAKTGFKLKGQHAKQDCSKCHNSEHNTTPQFKKRVGSYLGMNQKCTTCHDDFHQGKLSAKCDECHNFNNWENAQRFDHSKTEFPLKGKHQNVGCIECHKTEIVKGKKVQRFEGLVFNNCTGCHKDVHNNKFGQDCKQCHTEESFHFNKSMTAFNHDKTNFKLLGKHKQVDCKQCHKGSLTAPLKHDRCMDCHKDYHKGDFTANNKTPDCNTCHTNDGFTPSTFTIERHNKAGFKLEDAHLATSCTQCHKKDNKDWHFRNIGKRCVDCHKNEHKGYMDDKFMPNEDCAVCHTVKDWKVNSFDHCKTGYILEGEHAKTACADCHYSKNSQGVRTQKFKGTSRECSACHKDNHFDQFAVNGKTDCSRCHDFNDWKAKKFDHNTSRFKIDGKHVGVKCQECHKEITTEKGKYIEYKFDNIDCKRCHS